MPHTINPGYTDTPITGGKQRSFKAAPVNFGADFRPTIQKVDETVVTNITSPTDRPETYRFAFQDIKDIYRNAGVSAGFVGPVRSGRSIVVQHNATYAAQETDSATNVTEDHFHLPVGMHLVMRVPNSELITPELVIAQLERLLAGLQETGSDGNTRLLALMRGSMKPKDV